ncbi:acyltransferase [Microbacterium sp. H37-C3]|uniref:acyltransferase family protein n=1 Tax=Microbacterium sp. H37-C3 TaxID=3004354 RepID=UPI0022B0599B|nr:acyltransferase [Microbacterium sp. H37-C3]MCZ4068381.1 acyltransferase [Microbacterium sp. H37-C3]
MRGRLHGLDGVRGAAALVVLVHHVMLTFAVFAVPYRTDDVLSGPAAWVTYTPLHLFWDGASAVFVFFVLSGVVLTLMVTRERFSWVAYYPSRLLRLYLPVWAAVALGILWIIVIPRGEGMDSLWLDARGMDVTFRAVFRDLFLLTGHGNIVSPLWSLRWEIYFSLLLPAYVIPLVKWPRLRIPALLASVVAIGIGGWFEFAPLRFLPMFMVGVVIALYIPQLQALGHRSSPRTIGIACAGSLLLLPSPWYVASYSSELAGAMEAFCVLGAAVLIVIAIVSPAAQRAFGTGFLAWVGTISFALYLVHEPVVISAVFLLGSGNEGWAVLISVPASFALAVLFFRFVEKPAHRVSSAVGKAIQRRVPAPSPRSAEKRTV